MPRLPMVRPRQVVRALEQVGFEIDHQTGSHVVLWRASDGSRVVVPWHSRDLGWRTIAPIAPVGLRPSVLDCQQETTRSCTPRSPYHAA
jgi:predicted RNA binding protein YcfA (HicA-like mRNA interferase family)